MLGLDEQFAFYKSSFVVTRMRDSSYPVIGVINGGGNGCCGSALATAFVEMAYYACWLVWRLLALGGLGARLSQYNYCGQSGIPATSTDALA